MSENSIDNDNYKCYTVNEMDALSSNPGDEGYMGPVSTYKDNFDVYFVVDRANYTDEALHSYCQKILETSEKIWAVSPNVNIVLYAVNGNGYSHFDYYGIFKNAGTLKTTLDTISQNKNVLTAKLSNGTVLREVYLSKAVDSIINKYDGKRKIYGFVFFDSANNIFQTKGDSKALLYGVKYGDRKINISVCSNIPEKYKTVGNYDEMSYAVALHKMTNGIDISAGDFTNQALEHIYGEVPKENQYQYQAIIATGYKPVVLKKKLTSYDMELAEKRYNDPDYIFSDAELADCEDTDEDGLKDFEEVMFYSDFVKESKFITFDNGIINLPKVADVMRIFEKGGEYAYVDGGIEKAREQYGNSWTLFLSRPSLPILSDPTCEDGDLDGKLDILEIEDAQNPLMVDNVYILLSTKSNNEINDDINHMFQYMYNSKEMLDMIMSDYYYAKKIVDVNRIDDERWNFYCSLVNMFVIKSYPAFDNLDELSSSLLNISPIPAEVHFFRNYLNRAPATLDELISENEKSAKWLLLPVKESVFHMYGDGGEFNVKFVSTDEYQMFEAVYNKEGHLLTYENDIHSCSTYNFTGPENPIMHAAYDVLPYYLYYSVPNVDNPYESTLKAFDIAIQNKNIVPYAVCFYMMGCFDQFRAQENMDKYLSSSRNERENAQKWRNKIIDRLYDDCIKDVNEKHGKIRTQ